MKKEKNKKNRGAIWAVVIFAAVVVCSMVITEIMTAKKNELQAIDVTNFKSEISSGSESLVLLTKNDCSKCESIKTELKKIKEAKSMNIYYINVDKLSTSDFNALLTTSNVITNDKFPNIIHISAGAIVGSYTGDANYNNILDFVTVFKTLKVADYSALAAKNEESYIYIGRPTCPHCVNSMPLLKRVAFETGKDIYYINIDEETSSSLQTLATETQIYDGSTPLFMVVKNGQVLRNHAGEDAYEALKAFFTGTETK